MIGFWYEDDRLAAYETATRLPKSGLMVEVGSFQGKSTCDFAKALGPGWRIHCIDKFEGIPQAIPLGVTMKQAREHLEKTGQDADYLLSPERLEHIKQFVCTGEEQLENFFKNVSNYPNISVEITTFDKTFTWREMVDFVFWDANHEYRAVKEGLEYWHARLKPGGLVAVHDYSDNWPGTKKAVEEYCEKYNKEFSVWSNAGYALIVDRE